MNSEDKEKLKLIFEKSGNDLGFLSSIMQSMGMNDQDTADVTSAAKTPTPVLKDHKHKKNTDIKGGAGGDKKAEDTGRNKMFGGTEKDRKAEFIGKDKKITHDIVHLDKDGIITNFEEIDPARISVHDICLQDVFGKCENEDCTRQICGPRQYLCKVLKSSKYNCSVASKFLKQSEVDTIDTINIYMNMSDEEHELASQVNSVCFWTITSTCKNKKCPKKFCGERNKKKIQEVILGSITGIKKFASFIGCDVNSLEKIPELFSVPLTSVPVLVKYLNDDKTVRTKKAESAEETGKLVKTEEFEPELKLKDTKIGEVEKSND